MKTIIFITLTILSIEWTFGNRLRVCTWENPTDCINVPLLAPSVFTERSCEALSMKPHESDCSKYYVCDHGSWQEMSCTPPLQFNSAINSCDWPTSSGCSGGTGGAGTDDGTTTDGDGGSGGSGTDENGGSGTDGNGGSGTGGSGGSGSGGNGGSGSSGGPTIVPIITGPGGAGGNGGSSGGGGGGGGGGGIGGSPGGNGGGVAPPAPPPGEEDILG